MAQVGCGALDGNAKERYEAASVDVGSVIGVNEVVLLAVAEIVELMVEVLSELFAVLDTASMIVEETIVVNKTVPPSLSVDPIVVAISVTDVVNSVVEAVSLLV